MIVALESTSDVLTIQTVLAVGAEDSQRYKNSNILEQLKLV